MLHILLISTILQDLEICDAGVSITSQIRVSAMFLLLTVGK